MYLVIEIANTSGLVADALVFVVLLSMLFLGNFFLLDIADTLILYSLNSLDLLITSLIYKKSISSNIIYLRRSLYSFQDFS